MAVSKHTQIRHQVGREGQSCHWSWLDQGEITVSSVVLLLTGERMFLKSQIEKLRHLVGSFPRQGN